MQAGKLGALLGLMSLPSPAVYAAVPADFLFRNTEANGSGMPYRIFVPPGYDPAQRYPLIVFLHGAGEAGTNNTSQLNNGANGAMQLISDANLATRKVFMAAPQCPHSSGCWAGGTQLAQLNTMLDRIATEFRIDADRVHVTGISMGGNGTWALVANAPQRFASAVPICGWGSPGQAPLVGALPFWFFHAVNDGTVGVSGSRDLVNALRNANARTIYTEYATGGHFIWTPTYANPLLFRWITAQARGAPSLTTPPIVRIEDPTTAPTWTTELGALPLAGVTDNGGHAVTGVAWARRNGTNGAANGTTQWTTPAIALAMGVNDLRMTATGSGYHAPWGGSTTISAPLRVNRVNVVPQPGDTVAAINAGGAAYTGADGAAWSADTAFEGGDVQVSSRAIAGTVDDALYNDWRWGNFAYRFVVPQARYEIDLHFAETYNAGAGARRFNVTLQGVRVLDEFDIAATAGIDTAHVRRYLVEATDGEVVIRIGNGSIGNARLDALKVVRSADAIFRGSFE